MCWESCFELVLTLGVRLLYYYILYITIIIYYILSSSSSPVFFHSSIISSSPIFFHSSSSLSSIISFILYLSILIYTYLYSLLFSSVHPLLPHLPHSFYTCRYLFMFTYIPPHLICSSSPSPLISFILYLSILIYVYLYSIHPLLPHLSHLLRLVGIHICLRFKEYTSV